MKSKSIPRSKTSLTLETSYQPKETPTGEANIKNKFFFSFTATLGFSYFFIWSFIITLVIVQEERKNTLVFTLDIVGVTNCLSLSTFPPVLVSSMFQFYIYSNLLDCLPIKSYITYKTIRLQ